VVEIIKKACARANYELKLFDGNRAPAFQRASGEVVAGKWNAELVANVCQAGDGVSYCRNSNGVIANLAIEILYMKTRGLCSLQSDKSCDLLAINQLYLPYGNSSALCVSIR